MRGEGGGESERRRRRGAHKRGKQRRGGGGEVRSYVAVHHARVEEMDEKAQGQGGGLARQGTRKCTTTLGSGQVTELSELGLVD